MMQRNYSQFLCMLLDIYWFFSFPIWPSVTASCVSVSYENKWWKIVKMCEIEKKKCFSVFIKENITVQWCHCPRKRKIQKNVKKKIGKCLFLLFIWFLSFFFCLCYFCLRLIHTSFWIEHYMCLMCLFSPLFTIFFLFFTQKQESKKKKKFIDAVIIKIIVWKSTFNVA